MKNKIITVGGIIVVIAGLTSYYFTHFQSPDSNRNYSKEISNRESIDSGEDVDNGMDDQPLVDSPNNLNTPDNLDQEINSWTDGSQDGFNKPVKIKEGNKAEADKNLASEYEVSSGEKIKLVKGVRGTDDDKIWSIISAISPDELSNKYIESYQIFNSPGDDTLAFVDDEDGNGKWRVAVNTATFLASDKREKYLTVIHELGHIVMLNDTQVLSSEDKDACKTFYTGDSCALKGSYILAFADKYWKNPNLNNDDDFITDYAKTDAVEDAAESFAYFVLDDKPDLTKVSGQKVNSFYSFPDLVKIRNSMRGGVKNSLISVK